MRTARGNELESIHGPEKKYRLGGGEVRDVMEKKRDSSCVGSLPYRAHSIFLCTAGKSRAGAVLLTSVQLCLS